MQELKIDKEFQALIPALTDKEYRGLEDSIVKEGCRDAIVVWNNTIVDGHNRYEICKKNNIKFEINETTLEEYEKEDIKIWG